MPSLELMVAEVLSELDRARRIHPRWPDDVIHAVSIVNEESGEAIRAALNAVYLGGDPKDIRKELIQTAAMCLRCLENLP